jgi:hypothetical protein
VGCLVVEWEREHRGRAREARLEVEGKADKQAPLVSCPGKQEKGSSGEHGGLCGWRARPEWAVLAWAVLVGEERMVLGWAASAGPVLG